MKKKDKQFTQTTEWETIEALESIANQCIYTGKEVAEARALLKSVYNRAVEYNDDANCSTQ